MSPGDNEAATIRMDAERRQFSPEQIRNFVTHQEEFDGMLDFMQGTNDDDGYDARAAFGDAGALDEVAHPNDGDNVDDAQRLRDEIAREPSRPARPVVTPCNDGRAIWHDGTAELN